MVKGEGTNLYISQDNSYSKLCLDAKMSVKASFFFFTNIQTFVAQLKHKRSNLE